MVALAKDWKTVGKQLSYSTPTDKQGYDIPYAAHYSGGVVLTASIGASDMAIRKLEHVQLIITINARARGDIVIVLEAPTATKSVLLTRRPRDYRSTMDWTFMTVRHWDESPLGDWKLYISNANAPNRDAEVVAWSLKFYGTSGTGSVTSCPQGKYLSAAGECQACHDECTSAGCTGPGPLKCTSCLHYHTADGKCVFDCADEKMLNPAVEHGQCLPCHDSCDGVSFKQGGTVVVLSFCRGNSLYGESSLSRSHVIFFFFTCPFLRMPWAHSRGVRRLPTLHGGAAGEQRRPLRYGLPL